MTDPDPIVTKSLTISEMMDGDGVRWISIDTEGNLEHWDALGMLDAAVESYKLEARQAWAAEEDD